MLGSVWGGGGLVWKGFYIIIGFGSFFSSICGSVQYVVVEVELCSGVNIIVVLVWGEG